MKEILVQTLRYSKAKKRKTSWNILPCDDKKEPYFLNPLSTKKNSRWYNSNESNSAQEIPSGTWMRPRLWRGHASPGGSGYGGPAWPPEWHWYLKRLPREIRILQLRLTMVFGGFLRFLKATCVFQWFLSTFSKMLASFSAKFSLTRLKICFRVAKVYKKKAFTWILDTSRHISSLSWASRLETLSTSL